MRLEVAGVVTLSIQIGSILSYRELCDRHIKKVRYILVLAINNFPAIIVSVCEPTTQPT